MSYTPYNAPLLSPILGDRETAAMFGVQADIRAMLRFETALARSQAKIGMISPDVADEIETAISAFEPDMETLTRAIARDGMVVPGLVKQLRLAVSAEIADQVHLHCTSQDVIDTSAMMRMKACSTILSKRLSMLVAALKILLAQNSGNAIMAYTRMQAALPTNAEERIQIWLAPLEECLAQLDTLEFPLQLAGPIGSSKSYDGKRSELATHLSEVLSLDDTGRSWQTDRTPMINLGHWLTTVSGHLGKIGTDVTLMAQMGSQHITMSGGGTSSAMAHKQNPVLAETLVTIARFNAGLMGTLYQSQLHEQERSGSAWMNEWMIMPQLFVATGAALRNAVKMVETIEAVGQASA